MTVVRPTTSQPAGPPADAQGRTSIDPTENVKAIVEAAVKRLDDLREMSDKCQTEVANLRSEYEDKLRDAESKRLDSIRNVDVGNVDRAAKDAIERANTLATQVASTALAFDAKLAAALDPIIKDIADLRRVQYEGVGQKTQVTEGRDTSKFTIAVVGFVLSLILSAGTVASILAAIKK